MPTKNILHRIVSALDAADDRDVGELPPLYNSVDAEALEVLIKSGVDRVEFQHAEYRIGITHDEVTVRDMTDDGKVPYPDDIEDWEGGPDESNHGDVIIRFDGETKTRALAALKETTDPAEEEYLSALLTMIDYHNDETFEDPLTR